ncbi:MAG: hypothetical protein ACODAJ_07525 [Planctomycetota bacterium]
MTFWKMAPVEVSSLVANAGRDSRAMAWPRRWRVQRFHVVAMKRLVLATAASGRLRFDAPAARAVLTHLKRID